MARPAKTKVDYFPHMTHSGKTIAILEARWGNDGYAFWFKLLELLGDSNDFCDDEIANGTEVFYYPGSETGHALACCIQSELVALCRTVDRKVKTNDEWTVLRETAMPAVLVELAFLTNEAERARLTSGMGQRQFAEGLVKGINRFADGGPLFGKVMESPAPYSVNSA